MFFYDLYTVLILIVASNSLLKLNCHKIRLIIDLIGFQVTYGLALAVYISRREGTIGCLLHKSPKSYNKVFLFVGYSTLVNFDRLVY